MNLRCLMFGHSRIIEAPLLTRCTRCGACFETDYFESRARDRLVRYRITEEQMQRELERRGYGRQREKISSTLL